MRNFTITLALCAAAASAVAQNTDVGIATVPLPLSATVRQEEVAYDVPRYTVSATQGTNSFAFRVPAGFYLRNDPASGILTLANRRRKLLHLLCCSGPDSSDISHFNADEYRKQCSSPILQPKSSRVLRFGIAIGSGPGFDLQWKAAGDLL